MAARTAEIRLDIFNKKFCVKINVDDDISLFETRFEYSGLQPEEVVSNWLMTKAKKVLYKMPVEAIRITPSPEVMDKFKNAVNSFFMVIKSTNEFIQSIARFENVGQQHENFLIYNMGDDSNYKNFYDELRKTAHNVLYKNMESGFDPVLRKWNDLEVPEEASDLVAYLVENRVCRILSLNHYVLERYLAKRAIYLQAVFYFLGIEHIITDHDYYDLGKWDGFLQKHFYNNNRDNRYVYPLLDHYLEKEFGHINSRYITSITKCADEREIVLHEDYKILVLSNSRAGDTHQLIPAYLYVMDQLGEKDLFYNFQLWFVSLQYLIMRVFDMDPKGRQVYNSKLLGFFYMATQLFKFEVISNIKTDRAIEIYGDDGWDLVFPEYYQKKYVVNEEKDEMLKSGKYLLLLPGWSLSWLFREWTFLEGLNSNTPFISASSVTMLPELEPLRQLEFKDSEELNSLVRSAHTIYQRDEILDSLSHLKQTINAGYDEVSRQLLAKNSSEVELKASEYNHRETMKQLDHKILKFVDQNLDFLRTSFNVLFLGQQVDFDATRSRLYHKSYVQGLLDKGSSL